MKTIKGYMGVAKVSKSDDGDGLIIDVAGDGLDYGRYFAPYTGGVWALSKAGVLADQTRDTYDAKAPLYRKDAAVRRFVLTEFLAGAA